MRTASVLPRTTCTPDSRLVFFSLDREPIPYSNVCDPASQIMRPAGGIQSPELLDWRLMQLKRCSRIAHIFKL